MDGYFEERIKSLLYRNRITITNALLTDLRDRERTMSAGIHQLRELIDTLNHLISQDDQDKLNQPGEVTRKVIE